MDRIDEPFLPPKAIREAVINAIIHRDYTIYGSAINVAIYDDRIVVESYGTLPKKITLDKLKTNHKSYPRNPVIADVFYNRGFIEQWGRGTQLIVEYCLAAGHPEPEFIEDAGGLTVCMYSKYPMQTQIDLVPEIHVQLEPRELKIFEILTTHLGGLSSGELTEVLQDSLGKRTVLRDLRNLEDKGLVCRKGKGNKIIWVKV
jgi:ATP-dependent DNA helicase RecG